MVMPIFLASLLILCCSFLSSILSSIVMISFYILSKRLFLKGKGLSNTRVVSSAKKEYTFPVRFLKRLIKSSKSISDE